MTYAIPMPTIAGMVAAHDGTTFDVTTPSVSLSTIRADFTLTDSGSSDCIVVVGTATVSETVTIPSGDTYVSHSFTDTYTSGDIITLEIQQGDGLNLSGALYVQSASGVAPTTGLVTLAETKTALGISGASAADDVFLDRQIAMVSEVGRNYCHRQLIEGTYTEVFYNPTSVDLREYPVDSLTTVDKDGTELTIADVRADLARGRIWQPESLGRMNWQDTQKLSITYTGGYDPVPQGVREWCYQAVYSKWLAWPDERGFAPGGQTVARIVYPDAGSVEYQARGVNDINVPDWLAGVPLSALDPWRDPANAMSDEFWTWI